jgi:polysaccharide deacetylase 2 family uncharacterized protein YibQ
VADDLSAPLGQITKRKAWKIPLTVPAAVAAALAFCLVVFVIWAVVVTDPFGGEPMVVLSTNTGAEPNAANAPDNAAAPAQRPAADSKVANARAAEPAQGPAGAGESSDKKGGQTVNIIDGTTGKQQEVVVASPPQAAVVDQKLLEVTRHGPIPRVGVDGARPVTAYASPINIGPGQAALPRVALVVGGLGISANNTAEAMRKLPAPVTLAFAPYAAELERLVSRARSEGHEILLQIPMEPFDYPDNDPGPQTLLTSLAPEQNIDRMHWLMSRFQGYVGVCNYMGARFTASEATLGPVLREVAKRGLLFVDDGSSPRSLAGQIAGASNLGFAKANVVLDAVPAQAEIDRAFTRLENMARESGFAVGIATALPVSISRLAQWANSAQSRGFLLVPISAAVVKPKSS